MSNNYIDKRLTDLIDAYRNGLYLDTEVVSVCMDLLADENVRERLWLELPRWVSTKIEERLAQFQEAEDVVTFGHGKPEVVKAQMVSLKHWLRMKGAEQSGRPE